MHRYKLHLENIETINVTRYNTNWKPRMTIKIINDTDDAIKDMEQDPPDVKIFTDGSGMEGKLQHYTATIASNPHYDTN